jgi:hypothetical protein
MIGGSIVDASRLRAPPAGQRNVQIDTGARVSSWS